MKLSSGTMANQGIYRLGPEARDKVRKKMNKQAEEERVKVEKHQKKDEESKEKLKKGKNKAITQDKLLKVDLKLLVSHYRQDTDSPVKESANDLKQQYDRRTKARILFEHEQDQQEKQNSVLNEKLDDDEGLQAQNIG